MVFCFLNTHWLRCLERCWIDTARNDPLLPVVDISERRSFLFQGFTTLDAPVIGGFVF
jgi:hypothetical protein